MTGRMRTISRAALARWRRRARREAEGLAAAVRREEERLASLARDWEPEAGSGR